jgi:hypothetical protein
VRYLMLGMKRRALMRVVGGTATLLALAAPAAAWAGQMPERSRLSARLVTAAPAAKPQGVRRLPLRTMNPVRYAKEKAVANRAYQAWAAKHQQVFGPGLTIGTAPISGFSNPGMAAAASGGSTPPDTTGAIGPTAYVEFVNSRVGVFNRSTLASVAQVPETRLSGASTRVTARSSGTTPRGGGCTTASTAMPPPAARVSRSDSRRRAAQRPCRAVRAPGTGAATTWAPEPRLRITASSATATAR